MKLQEDKSLPGLSLPTLKKAVVAAEEGKDQLRCLEAACELAAAAQCAPLPAFHARAGRGHAAAALESHLFPQETKPLSPLLLVVALIITHWFTKVDFVGVFSLLLVRSYLFAPSRESGHVGKQKKRCLLSPDTLASVPIKP